MTGAGFTIAGEDHAISPVMLMEEKLNAQFASLMLEEDLRDWSELPCGCQGQGEDKSSDQCRSF